MLYLVIIFDKCYTWSLVLTNSKFADYPVSTVQTTKSCYCLLLQWERSLRNDRRNEIDELQQERSRYKLTAKWNEEARYLVGANSAGRSYFSFLNLNRRYPDVSFYSTPLLHVTDLSHR